MALCFAPFDNPGMVWLGLVPLMVAVWRGGKARRRGWYGFRIGYVAGLAFWMINLKWIIEVGAMGWVAMSVFLALYFALWGTFAAGVGNPWRERTAEGARAGSEIEKKIRAKTGAKAGWMGASLEESKRVMKFALVNACWWCGLEWVRGWFLTGFGWNGLGVAFHDQPILAQSAELVGVTGLSFLPVFVMGGVVQVGRGLQQEVKAGKRRAHWDFGAAMVLLSGCFLFGVWKLHGEKGGKTFPLKVLMVQLNIPQEASRRLWEPEEIHRGYEEETLKALRELESMARTAAESGTAAEFTWDEPDWIMWPESALSDALFYVENGEQGIGNATANTLDAVRAQQGNFTMIFGLLELEAELTGRVFTRKDRGKSFNSLLAQLPGEPRFRTYRKQHLVLFGETIPYVDKLKFLQKLWEISAGTQYGGSFSAGEQEEPMRLPHAASPTEEVLLVPTICFEDTVARKMRKFVKKGGQVIVNVTNDGWFKQSEAAAQHFANAKFRSIEFRRPTIRCANTGVSAIIGAHGTVLDRHKDEMRILTDGQGSHLTRGSLFATAHVPVDGPLTLYTRFGDWFAVLGFVVGLGWWTAARWAAKRSSQSREKG